MKRIFTFISLIFFAFSIAEAQQNNISLNEFKTQNPDLDHFHSIDNHHYFIKDELISWTDAKNYGDQIGVSMYIINSSDEENEVYTNLPLSGNNGFGYLIGLYQDTNDTSYSEPDGGWKWIDGTSLTYSNWETNEPNNANNGEDYAHFDWQGGGVKWNDIASSPNVNKAIYEFVDYSADILLNGTVSAESNQIKNVADPINAQDVATKSYVDSNINSFSGSYNDLTDTPTMYTQAQVDALISNLQSQIDGLAPPQGAAAINHNNKTYSGVSCDGFWLGFKFSVSESQTITALGAWDEGHNVEVNDEFSSCPDASNFSVPIAIYKNDVLVLEKVINASTGFVIGNSRYIKIDDFVLTPGDEYFVIGNYEGSSKFGYFNSNLVSTDYDNRITPLTVTSSPVFSKNTNGDGTFPSNLTTLSHNQWSDQYFHVNFLIRD